MRRIYYTLEQELTFGEREYLFKWVLLTLFFMRTRKINLRLRRSIMKRTSRGFNWKCSCSFIPFVIVLRFFVIFTDQKFEKLMVEIKKTYGK